MLLLAAALAVRLVAGIWWQQRLPAGQRFGFPDSESYWALGQAIAHGQPYEFGAERSKIFRMPGYPILLAGIFRIAGDNVSVQWARVLSAVLGTAAVAGVAWLTHLLFDERTALVAACLATFYPETIAMSTFVLSEAPFCPLLVLQLICWTLAWRAESQARQSGLAIAGGIAAGIATLMRPSWLLFTPFAIGVGMLCSKQRGRQAIVGTAMLVGLCISMLPWWVRNYRLAGRFIPTTLQVGASLYDGISPQATGASDMNFVAPFLAEQRQADALATQPPKGLFEARLDHRMHAAAIAWARDNPGRVLQLAAIKFLRMWNFWPNTAELGSWSLRLALSLTYVPILALSLFGVWKFARRDWPYLLCLLPAVYFTLLHMIFVSSIRYRQPAMLVLIVLAAGAIVGGWNYCIRPRPAQSAAT
jgi:4-amino-4-deoxy-L-arabinose transferase-like glycosyltransferase